MQKPFEFLVRTTVGGLLIIVPVYLAVLLVLKGMATVGRLVRPFARLLPEWFPAEQAMSLLLVLLICFLIGLAVKTRTGQVAREKLERTFFERIPGYAVLRSLAQQMAGHDRETAWKPALVDIEDALVPGFIIEQFEDGRYTIFVPSIPTPLAGAVYVLPAERVHPVDVPFTHALRTVSRWGSGAKDLVAVMEQSSRSADKGLRDQAR